MFTVEWALSDERIAIWYRLSASMIGLQIGGRSKPFLRDYSGVYVLQLGSGEMMENTIELTLNLPPQITKAETQTLLAIKFYETGRLSLGKAAELAGYSKRAFIEILGHHQIPIFNYSPEDLRKEVG